MKKIILAATLLLLAAGCNKGTVTKQTETPKENTEQRTKNENQDQTVIRSAFVSSSPDMPDNTYFFLNMDDVPLYQIPKSDTTSVKGFVQGQAIANPLNKDEVIFNTWEQVGKVDEGTGIRDTIVRFYGYDKKTKKVRIVYEEAANKHGKGQELEIFGSVGSQLIVHYHDIGVGGPCDYPFELPNLKTMDMNDLSAVKKNYTAPKELVDQDKQRTDECFKSIEEQQ